MKILIAAVALAGAGAAAWKFCPCEPCCPGAGAGTGGAVAAMAAAHDDDADDDADDEVAIGLDQVPSKALDAARGAVPGIALCAAERETEGGRTVYCLEGTKDGVRHEVEVTEDGTVVEVETGD